MTKNKRFDAAVKKATKSIEAAIKRGASEGADGCFSHLYENAYYYRKKLKELRGALPYFEHLPAENGMPHVFLKLWSTFKEEGFVFDKELLVSAFSSSDLNGKELDMLCGAVCAAALIETGLICEKALSKENYSIGRLHNAFRTLKKAEVSDFTALYPRLSTAEALLCEKEELYAHMTEETKAAYRKALGRYAKKKGKTETEALAMAFERASRDGVCVGKVLGVDKGRQPFLYSLSVLLLFSFILFCAFLLCSPWCAAILLIPFGALALSAADFIFSVKAKVKHCPAIKTDCIPKEKLTLTVITTLLDNEGKSFDAIRRFCLANSQSGLYFGILADLPNANAETVAEDTPLIEEAVRRINTLNEQFGDKFCLFIRKRTQNANGTWNGKERKRGAIEELVRYLYYGEGVFLKTEGADARGVKFLLTLDTDTNIPPESVAALSGMMLHPLNRPVAEKGKIIRGYGILQPMVETALDSSTLTPFASLISGVGGIEVYESGAFNREQSVFGEGIFCGKGIIDVSAYATVLAGILPEGRVLSHDMPEGNILRTRYVSDLRFTDNVPAGILAYYSRLNRWIRGDTQNLSLVKGYRQGFLGSVRMIKNVMLHLCPILSLAALAVAGFADVKGRLWLCLFAVLNLISPVFFTLISEPRALKFKCRCFFSSVKSGTLQSLSLSFYELCALCHKAYVSADAVFKALFRLATGKKLLSWVTAAEAEKNADTGILSFIRCTLPSALTGFVFFFATELWVTRLLGLLWFLFPVYANFLSQPVKKTDAVPDALKKSIKLRALPIWNFFSDNVGEKTSHLPPDNIQFAPTEAVAMRTSPTNIGLYLLSVVAAEDFGFITPDEAARRIDNTLGVLEGLEKWKGHFYNWYDLKSTRPLNGYVSTVDSGNLCVCLVALTRHLYSSGRTDSAKRVENLYEGADFSALYNAERNLFSLGYDAKEERLSDICYDLYMSEARSTSYFAVALGKVPPKHWGSLSRPIVESLGYIGMASWSGTAFEYFMPQLFLPLYKGSFAYESLRFALKAQKSFAYGKLWGISESGYFCFDSEMNYQYKAHGVQSLALCRHKDKELVLSPYSVYLSMCIAPAGAMRTVAAYEAEGYSGIYGLYEAVDCTGGGTVQSYMAHHMGMSLIACANACFENVFVKRFMSHPRTEAFYELLQEKIPVGASIHDAYKVKALPRQKRGKSPAERLTEYDASFPVFHISSHGGNTITANSTGHVRFAKGDISLNETHFTPCSAARSLCVMFCQGNKVYSAAPYGFNEGNYFFESADAYSAHICSSREFSGRVKYYTDAAGCFVAESKSDGGKSYSLVFSFDVQLAEDKSFYAHPSFSRLFITASYDKENNAIIYCKNIRDGKEPVYMAVGLSEKKLRFDFETNKESYEAFSLYRPEDVLKPKYSSSTGVCISPFCLIKTPPVGGGEIRLIVSVAHSKNECIERLNASRRGSSVPCGSSIFGERENPLLKAIYYGRELRPQKCVTRGELWARGLSDDYPIIAVRVRELSCNDVLFYIRFFKRLAAFNKRIELVFLVCEEDKYSSPITAEIKRIIRKERCENFVGRRGGIFFADGNDKESTEVFKDGASIFTECFDTPFEGGKETKASYVPVEICRKKEGYMPSEGNKVFGGAYKNGVFTVDKSELIYMPYSYVLAGKGLCSVVSHGSLGYSFCGNSALRRIAAFEGDPYGGTDTGEAIYCFRNGKRFDLIACALTVSYGEGTALYRGRIEGKEYSLLVFVCERLPLKVMRLSFDSGEETDALFTVKPLMGSGAFPANEVVRRKISFKEGTALGFANGRSDFFHSSVGFIACLGAGEADADMEFAIKHKGKETVFLLGAAPEVKSAEAILHSFAKSGVKAEEDKARRFAVSMTLPISVSKMPLSTAEMLCRFAPYTAAACRFFARGAFYQSSGAYGFRDQLQDCMLLAYTMPRKVRTHIIRAAARQYTDGGVQHWWHPNKRDGKLYGVRSKCSDDFLWLPICVAEYVRITGDMDILRVEIPYLKAEAPLAEKERYEAAEVTDAKESLYIHCVRALEHGKNFGSHGLPLMGSCDWNDAFSDLGENAESVFSGFLYVIALKRFACLARKRGDGDYAERCINEANAMLEKCEACYEKNRYIRAYDGEGRALGVQGRAACEIDILCQAFAVFAGADREKCRTAMETAYKQLYDKENKLLKLFTPPFGADTEYAGYINAYAKGVRENGGQYTHAALWFAAAAMLCGMKDEAMELMNAINPLWRAENPLLFSRYRAEPYAIAADIYTARGQMGRAGWTHYTGAAAWYAKLMLEVFMGIKFSDGYKSLVIKPRMEYDAELNFFGKIRISAKKGNPLTIDGKATELPITLDGKEHIISVPVE